ncbi:hypothetical protein D3C77_626570 [compost metagenome]
MMPIAMTPATSAQGVCAVESAPSFSIAACTSIMCSNSSSRICCNSSTSALPESRLRALAIIASYRRTPLRSNARRSPSLSMNTSGLLPFIMSKPVLSMPLAEPGTGTEPMRSASSLRSARSTSIPCSSPGTSG